MTDRAPPPAAPCQQFNVRPPPELIRTVKRRALDDPLSLSERVERALIACLETGGGDAG